MNANEKLIETLYEAIGRLDYKTAQGCYHEEAVFEDPVFGKLNSQETAAMWEMLFKRAENFSASFSEIKADEATGSGHLVAKYTFSKTKRPVVNSIHSKFRFKEGKILSQKDSFNLWKWSRQAFGMPGLLLGWFPPFQKKINHVARESLDRFMEKQR